MSQNLLDAQNNINSLLNAYSNFQHPIGAAQQGLANIYGGGTSSPLGPTSPTSKNAIEIVPVMEYERLKKVDKEYIELLELLNEFIGKYVNASIGSEEEQSIFLKLEDNLNRFLQRTTNV